MNKKDGFYLEKNMSFMIKNDPYELKNIVENEKYAKLIEEFKFELNKWINLPMIWGEIYTILSKSPT